MVNDNLSIGSSVMYQLQAKESDFCCEESYDDVSFFVTEEVRIRLEDDMTLTSFEKEIIQRLAMRSFHLPGNTYWEDWHSFLCNNHPILGFRFAHPSHPFGIVQRLCNLVASISFGIAATCIVILWYYYKGRDMSEVVLTIYNYDLSAGNMSLLIFGTFLHVVFDLSIWYIQACPLCRPNGLLAKRLSEAHQRFWVYLGTYFALEITVFAFFLAAFVVLLRASLSTENLGDDDDKIIRIEQTGIQDYFFVAAMLMEFAVTQAIMFPIGAFILFSGILGCGRIPVLGGRPYQYGQYQLRAMRKYDTTTDCNLSCASTSNQPVTSKPSENRIEV